MAKKITSEKKLSYPQLGNYDIPIQYFVNHGLELEYVVPPAMTKRTIEIGSKYSPDFVCAPFKYMMGCYIEAMEKGANVIIQTGGTCRLGYYGELHEQILNDLGYEFEMFDINLARYKNLWGLYKGMKQLNPKASLPKVVKALPATARMITDIDKIEDYMRCNMGFEVNDGDFERVHKKYLAKLRTLDTLDQVVRLGKAAMRKMKEIPVNKPENPLKVGVIGEYFTIMDPYSNHEVEKKIAKMGAEVHRWMDLSSSVMICPESNSIRRLGGYLDYDIRKFPSSLWFKVHGKEIEKYAKYDLGGSSVATIAKGVEYAEAGFDGLIHVKSFGCTPEMDAVPVLHNVSADYKIPIMYLNFDTQTSDTGIETRLEAFFDMISMKKEAKITAKQHIANAE